MTAPDGRSVVVAETPERLNDQNRTEIPVAKTTAALAREGKLSMNRDYAAASVEPDITTLSGTGRGDCEDEAYIFVSRDCTSSTSATADGVGPGAGCENADSVTTAAE